MTLNILAIGDVVGEGGQYLLSRQLQKLKEQYQIDFTVVNGENAAGVGIVPKQAVGIYDAGGDVITLGNHTWSKLKIGSFLDQDPNILRPANYAQPLPGRGFGVFVLSEGWKIGVINLMGRLNLNPNLDSPFQKVDQILKQEEMEACHAILVDFHAETTSEKGAMAWYLDGRVQAVWGTHTHVPTADTQILPNGTGFVTDLGMTGRSQSVLGMKPENSINIFLGGLPRRYEEAEGPCKINGCRFTIDCESRRCVDIQRVDWAE